MSNAELKAKTFYRKTINSLQKFFIESCTENQIIDKFKSQILKEFKLSVTFDDMMSQALKDYSKEIIDNFIQSQSFTNKVNFLDKINTIMYQIGYISNKAFNKLNQSIKKAKCSYDNAWQEGLTYLRNNSNVNEFRCQFLVRYCEVKQAEMESIMQDQQLNEENLQKLKNYYEDFFNRKCWEANVKTKLLTFIEDCFSHFQNKSQMLSPETIKKLDKKLGGAAGANNQQISINNMLIDIAQKNSYNNDQEAQQRLQSQIKNIQKALRKFSGLNLIKQKGIVLRLGKFGSLISGFAGTDADLDLTILTNSYVNETEFLKLLVQFLRKQYKEQDKRGGRRVIPQIIHAKIPLIQIKICERGKNNLKIDLIVNNILGVINSKFLKVYSKIKWIKNLGLLVKLWGKSVDLIGKNYLSSYAMILMLIHYLIKDKKVKAILDHRVITNQTPYFEYKRLKLNEIQQFKVYYSFKTQQKDVTSYERINYRKVLMGFMKYYGQDIWLLKKQSDRIITVDLNNDRQIDKQCAITIKDPFDQPHNPGRLKIESQQFFKQKFKDAYIILKNGQESKIKSLFDI